MRCAPFPIIGPSKAALGAAVLGLMTCGAGLTNDEPPAATEAASRPLNLLLSRAELRSFIRDYELKTGEVHTAPIDGEEVLVTAPGVLAPMRDASQDVGGGLFAPFLGGHASQGRLADIRSGSSQGPAARAGPSGAGPALNARPCGLPEGVPSARPQRYTLWRGGICASDFRTNEGR